MKINDIKFDNFGVYAETEKKVLCFPWVPEDDNQSTKCKEFVPVKGRCQVKGIWVADSADYSDRWNRYHYWDTDDKEEIIKKIEEVYSK